MTWTFQGLVRAFGLAGTVTAASVLAHAGDAFAVRELERSHGIILHDRCSSEVKTRAMKYYAGNITGVSKEKMIEYSVSSLRILFKSNFEDIIPDIDISKLNWQNRSICSGTLIAKDRILTAAHCFSKFAKMFSALGKKLTIDEVARLVDVAFVHSRPASQGRVGSVGIEVRYDISEVLEIVRPEQDACHIGVTPRSEIERCVAFEYALLKVELKSSDFDGDLPEPRPLSCATTADAEQAIILQHPQGVRSFSYGPIEELSGKYVFAHEVSTDRASSGSGVLDRRGYLVGMHVWGGCAKPYPPYNQRNFGIWIKDIADRSALIQCGGEN